jgi:hypothetical protein
MRAKRRVPAPWRSHSAVSTASCECGARLPLPRTLRRLKIRPPSPHLARQRALYTISAAPIERLFPRPATLLHGSASGRSDLMPSWSHAIRT